ncbi:MAG: cupin domain-containing protein [Phascolarctobacterium sp.]|nr:cupin domain-containing protein [Candidatus Phascolarctobacterium equi]
MATAYVHDVQSVSEEEPVVVCPVDPYVDDEYFTMLQKLCEQVKKDEANLVLMGIEPTYPSEKYGYIMPKDKRAVSEVSEFKEKPNLEKAEKYIAQGAIWNAGVFAYRLGYVLQKAKEYCGNSDYKELFANYGKLEKISFDYAVVEKEKSIQVMRYAGEWKDLGTWNTLTEAMSENIVGEGILGDCDNVHIVNELNMPLFAMGLKNVVISASPDGIIVSDKEKSSYIKPYVEQIHQRPMYEEREWGIYRVLDHQTNSLTKELVLKQGKNISYQRHGHRKEVWTFIQGEGLFLLDGKVTKVGVGDTVIIPVGAKHALKAVSELHFIEVQIGNPLAEEDIERFEWEW